MSTESLLIRRRVSMIATGVLAAAVALSIALVVGWVPVELAVMLRSRPSSGDGSDDDSARDASPLPVLDLLNPPSASGLCSCPRTLLGFRQGASHAVRTTCLRISLASASSRTDPESPTMLGSAGSHSGGQGGGVFPWATVTDGNATRARS